MDVVLDIVTGLLLLSGCFFALTSGVGMLRMPDFYTRIHPAGKSDTLGVLFIVSGLMLEVIKYQYGWLVAGKLLLVVLFILMTGPAATHAVSQAAYLDGLKPWRSKETTTDA